MVVQLRLYTRTLRIELDSESFARDFDALLTFIARPLCEVRLVDTKAIYLEVNCQLLRDNG